MQDMPNEQQTVQPKQELVLHARKHLTVTGVNDVIRFDEESVVLDTVLGILSVDGTDFHVTKLDLDSKEVVIEGNLNGMFYAEQSAQKAKKKIFGRT